MSHSVGLGAIIAEEEATLTEYVTMAEAAEILGRNAKETGKFLGRYQVTRYVQREDLLLAMHAEGRGMRSDMCVDPGGHLWDPTPEPLGEHHLAWCTRHGCRVGAVIVNGKRAAYRRRP